MHRFLGLSIVLAFAALAPAEASARARVAVAGPSSVVVAQPFAVTGTARPRGTVVLQRRRDGRWRRWRAVSGSRRFAFALRAPATARTLRLRVVLRRGGRVVARSRVLRVGVLVPAPLPGPFLPGPVQAPPLDAPPPDEDEDEEDEDPFAITPGAAKTISHEGVTLTVPAGTVSAPTTARITPLEDAEPGGFGADVHIDGEWEDGVKRVRVSMPLDPDALEPGFQPAVVHYGASGTEIIGGSGLWIDYAAKQVSFETTSLSNLVSTALPANWRIFSGPQVRDREALLNLFADFVGLRADQPRCSPDVTHNLFVSSTGSAFEPGPEAGGGPPLKHCVSLRAAQGSEFNRARWTVANNTGAVLRLSVSGGATPVNAEAGGDLLTDVAFAALNADGDTGNDGPLSQPLYLAPGGGASVTVPAGSSGRVSIEGVPGLLPQAFILRQVGDLLGSRSEAATLYERINTCGYTLALSGLKDLFDALNCARDLSSGNLAKVVRKVAFLGDAAIATTDTLTRSLDPAQADLAYSDPSGPVPADWRFDWSRPAPEYIASAHAEPREFDYRTSASNTGRIVAFLSETGSLDPDDPGDDPSVYVHDMAAGTTRFVGDGSLPKVSGDGEHVLYHSNGRLILHDLADGAELELPLPEDNRAYIGHDLSDDGDVIAYTANPLSDRRKALLYRRSTGRLVEVTLSSLYSDTYSVEETHVSADGSTVLFVADWQNGNNPYPVVYDVETGTDEQVAVDGQFNGYAISGDGRYVAYVVYEPPSGLRMPEAYVLDRETGTRQLLTPEYDQGGVHYDIHGWQTLSMSDSGRYVAYVRSHSSEVYAPRIEFVVHDVFDGTIRVVDGLQRSTSYQPRITGAGNAIVYARDTFTTAAEPSVRVLQAPRLP